MRVIVISLDSDTERRRSAGAQLKNAGIPFEWLDAIRGDSAINNGHFDRCEEHEFVLNTGRRAAEGEIGCFASHRLLWKRCHALDEPMLIMEDDFDLVGDFAGAVRCVEEIIGKCGFVRLQTDLRERKRPVMRPVDRDRDFTVSRYTRAPHGTLCYGISPAVALRFLSATTVIDAPVDVFIKKFWEHGQPLYALTPYTVTTSDLSRDSSITGRAKAKKGFRTASHRFLRKGAWHWNRLVYNLSYRETGKFVSTPAASASLPVRTVISPPQAPDRCLPADRRYVPVRSTAEPDRR